MFRGAHYFHRVVGLVVINIHQWVQWCIHCSVSVCSRWIASDIWMQMFDELLNVNSCSDLPDLMSHRQRLMAVVEDRVTVSRLNTYSDQLRRQLSS